MNNLYLMESSLLSRKRKIFRKWILNNSIRRLEELRKKFLDKGKEQPIIDRILSSLSEMEEQ
jgi:hypothetical protein